MIYLGEQIEALEEYGTEAICWLGVKLRGRQTVSKPSGYHCGKSSCQICNSSAKMRSGLAQDYRDLFSVTIIEEIIRAKPMRLFQLHKQLKNQYISLGYSSLDFKEKSKKLFVESGYENHWFLPKKWNYKLARLLDRHTCSYCNREYIFVHQKKSGKGMVPQFDHWFSKTDYPLLALSFYNLIPSCATCNGIKSTVTMDLNKHLHPYVDEQFSRAFFFSYLLTSSDSLRIILRSNPLFSKSKETFETSELNMIYKSHSDKELADLYNLRYKYSDNYLKVLLEKTFKELEMTDQEKYRLIFGIELEEKYYHKRIMSKFKKDIIAELLKIS